MLLITGTLLCLQYNKEDFMKKGKRILAAFLAVLMVVAIMPTSWATKKVKAATETKVYTLNALALSVVPRQSLMLQISHSVMDLKGHRELTLAKEQQQQRMLSDSQQKVQPQ